MHEPKSISPEKRTRTPSVCSTRPYSRYRSNRGLALRVAISQMMILSNHMQKAEVTRSRRQALLNSSLLSPRTWPRNLGKARRFPSIADHPWPRREELLVADEITIVFQVNGKLRGQAQFPKDAAKDGVIATAKADAKVQSFLDGKEIVKEIVRASWSTWRSKADP